MTGHVFHPGHAPLHGITVVVETSDERTYVGRYDVEDQRGIHLLDAGAHVPTAATQLSKDEYLRRCAKFGVASEHKHLVVPAEQVVRITRLSDIS
jgi:hypothetical protein